jgi:hypothetical protein
VLDHPRLRKREREKSPDGEERDQVIRDAAEDDQQQPRQERQDADEAWKGYLRGCDDTAFTAP